MQLSNTGRTHDSRGTPPSKTGRAAGFANHLRQGSTIHPCRDTTMAITKEIAAKTPTADPTKMRS
jgi:hypothetical protein